MKKIVEINGANYASTGKIMNSIAFVSRNQGFEVYTSCKKSRKSLQFNIDKQIYIGFRIERIISEYLAYLTGFQGSFNFIGTYLFIRKLKKIKPDIVHLHIMHDSYINLNMLFKYLKDNNIKVVYTMHDAWAITGKCAHFERANCYKWREGCNKCPILKEYPSTLIDRSKQLWFKKKKWLNALDLTIVTPSIWLASYIKESYLKDKDIKVIYNGIDLNLFKVKESDFKKKYNLENKFVILAVGYGWSARKGIDTFIKLASELEKSYQIVLVGTNAQIDKKLPSNIISIHRTYNQQELVDIYNGSDLFVNPSMEDNLPTVNIEALACGLPVLSYDTGGCKEIVDSNSGLIVKKGDYATLREKIIYIKENKPFKKEDCVNRAKFFNSEDKFKEYVNLYKELIK